MNSELLAQFLEWECTPYVADLLRSALEAARAGTGPPIRRFEFNRFEVTLDLEGGVVVLEDVVDPGDSGLQKVPIDDFFSTLIGN